MPSTNRPHPEQRIGVAEARVEGRTELTQLNCCLRRGQPRPG